MVLFSGKGMKMKVQKYEIARVIDKLKSIVQKNDQFPALGGILVKDGYFNRLQLRDYNEGQIRGLKRQLFYYSNESL